MFFTAFAVIVGLLPGLTWLVFYLVEDPHSEPRRLIAFTFCAGIVSGLIAIIIEKFLVGANADIGIMVLGTASLVGLAITEEILKFTAAYFSIKRTKQLSDPIDPMIYMIVAALGFATLENIGTLANASLAGPDGLTGILQTIAFRFIGATLLHTLSAGIIGYYWSVGMAKHKTLRFLALGLTLGAIVHFIFNYMILHVENISYAILFLLLVGLFVLNDFDALKAKEKRANSN